MKVIKNVLLEIVTLILLVINLYMFFIQSGIARIQQTTQEEFDAFWRTLSILSLIILIILVVVYIVSVKVFKRTIEKTFRSSYSSYCECDYTGTYKCNNGYYFCSSCFIHSISGSDNC